MATFQFSQVKGTSIGFRVKTDILNFDLGSAADLDITTSGTSLILRMGNESVALLNTGQVGQFSTTNITFSDGSLLLIGDDTTGTSRDSLANVLTGAAGNDRLIGMAGNDTLDGRDGSDTYVVTGTNDGTDLYRDTGTGGVDRIVAGANGAIIRLGADFSNALTGIEAISGNGNSGVTVVATGGADRLNFTGVSITGISQIDAQAGADVVVGSAGDDVIRGGAGADSINGAAGRDTAVFAGTRASYAITNAGGVVQVRDLDAVANGNDGTDTLSNVESLQFLDATVGLSAPTAMGDQAGTLANGGAQIINVLANDADADAGDSKHVVSVDTTGLRGSAWVAADGSAVHYTPGAAFQSLQAGATATETFTYTMADSIGAQSSATVTLTVTGTNEGPLAAADNATVQEDQSVLINVLANDTDPDAGDALRIVAIDRTGTLGSTAFATSDGVPHVYYAATGHQALKQGETATDRFSYTVADASGAESSTSVSVLVTGSNDAPIAFNDSAATLANGAPLTIDVLANDTDVDNGDTKAVLSVDGGGRPASFYLVQNGEVTFPVLIPAIAAIKGTVAVAAGGQGIVYTPGDAYTSLRAGEQAVETIAYTMVDGAGAQASAYANVTVTGVNDGPLAVADQASFATNAAPFTIDVLGNDTDPDAGDTKIVSAIDTLTHNTRGSVTLGAGGANVLYTVGSAFQGLAPGEIATDTFTYTMSDSAGATSTASVTVTITGTNAAPVAVNDAAGATENGAPLLIDVLGNDTDADPIDTKVVVSVSGPTQGSASVTPGGASVTYTVGNAFQSLRAGATATDTFSYTIADRNGALSTANVTVTVTGVNDAPIAVADGALAAEDGGPVFVDVRGNDADVDAGDTLSVVGLNATGLRGSVGIAPDGSGVLYTPYQSLRAGQLGTDTFSYTVRDSAGAQSTATVTMTVSGANDAPVAVANAVTLSEDAAPTTIAVLANDTDADLGDTKRVVSVTGDGLKGTVSVAANGSGVVYSVGNAFQNLVTGATATETFSYTMADSSGATSTSTVTVTITGATDGPKALNDFASTGEDSGSITLNVLANDLNDQNPGDTLTITSIDGAGRYSQPILGFFDGTPQLIGIAPGFARLLGDASIAADGRSINYTPLQSLNAGENGVDQFVYTLRGSDGATSTASVSVTVTGANDAPDAVDDIAGTAADGGPVTIDVLANDTDPDTRVDPPAPVIPPSAFSFLIQDPTPADVADTKTVIGVNGAGLQGSVAVAPGGTGVVYTPGGSMLTLAFGQSATETFTYTMQDGAGVQSTASVSVEVTGVNHAPTAQNDNAIVTENGAPVVINVLANDGDADLIAGDRLSVLAIDASGLQGSAVIDGGNIVYSVGNAFQSLRAGVTATDTFNYTVADSEGEISSASVTVTVTGVNDAPNANGDSLAISEDAGAVTIAVLANDTDADLGDTKTVTSVNTAGLQGSVSIAADGASLTYTVANGFQTLLSGQTALESFSYTMQDGAGVPSTATVSLTIVGANEPVVIVNPPPPPAGAMVGGAGDDIMVGTAGADIMYGQAGKDTISAGAGVDTLFGGADNDTLDGGAGNDILNGGAGRDDLTGGTGADTFRFYLTSDSNDPTKPDRIRDFSTAEGDKIDLSLIDANTILGGNNDFTFASAFTGSAGQLVVTFDPATGSLVRGDVNGDAVADFLIAVDRSVVSGSDFLL